MAASVTEVTVFDRDILRVEIRETPLTRSVLAADTTTFPAVTVTSATNANPVVITTASAHGWANNDLIRLAQCEGMTELNRVLRVVNVTATTAELQLYDGQNYINFNGVRKAAYVANSGRAAKSGNSSGANYKWVSGANLDYTITTAKWGSNMNTSNTFDQSLSRTDLRDKTQYSISGGYTITSLGQWSDAYEFDSLSITNVGYVARAPFSHKIYLKLDAPLRHGTYTITFPASFGLSDYTFTYHDQLTRCCAIHVNQVGVRPNDERKRAYLGGILPQGANWGEYQFSWPTNWKIIDAYGTEVFNAGAAPTLKHSPSDSENSWLPERIAADPYGPQAKAVTGLSGNTSNVTVTCVGHGLAVNDVVAFRWVQGATGLNLSNISIPTSSATGSAGNPFTVTAVPTADTFTINNASAPGVYTSGGVMCPIKLANSHGSYLYSLDFSALTEANIAGKHGPYRVYIPGLGVSDPFEIDEGAMYKLARLGYSGIYNQRSGCALDGELGFTRPVAYKHGTNGFKIYKSQVIEKILNEASPSGGALSVPIGSPWHSTEFAPEAYGGHFDAADYDQYSSHIESSIAMLYVWELLPAGYKTVDFGAKKAKDTIGGIYTTTYPDLIEEVIWSADWMRRCQEPGGGVPSYKGFDLSLSAQSIGDRTHTSFLDPTTWFIAAPTHTGTFSYAAVAAKLAWCFEQLGRTTEANTWKASAIAAYNWANAVYQEADPAAGTYAPQRLLYQDLPQSVHTLNPLVFLSSTQKTHGPSPKQVTASGFSGMTGLNGNTYTIRQKSGSSAGLGGNSIQTLIEVYDSTNTTAIDGTSLGTYVDNTGQFIPTTSQWSTTIATVLLNNGSSALARKMVAAGCLFRLTKDTTYRDDFDAGVNGGVAIQFNRHFAGWDYYNTYDTDGVTPLGTAGKRTSIKSSAASYADNYHVDTNGESLRGYSQLSGGYTTDNGSGQWGGSRYGDLDTFAVMFAHRYAYLDRIAAGDTSAQARVHSSVAKYTKNMQDGLAFLVGANPTGLSMGTGIGSRAVTHCYHRDHRLMGTDIPPGIFMYWGSWLGWWRNDTGTFGSGIANTSVHLSDTDVTRTNMEREVVPWRYSLPRFARYLPSATGGMVQMCEWTTYQCSLPVMCFAMYLHGWDGEGSETIQSRSKTASTLVGTF